MSQFSAMTASVSGMAEQANNLATISENISNTSLTVTYHRKYSLLAIGLTVCYLVLGPSVEILRAQTLSVWATPIRSSAQYDSVPAAPNVPVGIDSWDPTNEWSVPFYSATASDPRQPLLYNANAWSAVATGSWRRSGNSAAVEAAILASSVNVFPCPGNVYSSLSLTSWVLPASYNMTTNPAYGPAMFHFNPAMLPASGWDGHMAVKQPNGKVVETYATIILSTGQVIAYAYAVTDPTSAMDGWQNGKTASMLPNYGGLILDSEISSTIPHAMAVTIPNTTLAKAIVYPAYTFDRDAKTSYSGTIPMGGLLALPPSLSIASLGLITAEGAAIAAAAQKYGFIVVDRGGRGITIKGNPVKPKTNFNQALHTYSWQLQSDIAKIFANVVLVE
jgi:hypothetical protein